MPQNPMISSFFPNWGLPLSRLLRQVAGWWVAELSGMLPAVALRLIPGQGSPAVTLEFASDRAVLTLPGGAGPWLTLPLPDLIDAGFRRRVRTALDGQRQGNGVTIQLDSALIFETFLDLPAAGQSSLRPILQHQLERIVPLPSESVCFEYRLGPRRPNGATLRVHVAVVKREIIDRAIARAESAGLRPKQIIAHATGQPEVRRVVPYVFWRADQDAGGKAAHKRLCRILELLTVLTAIIAYGSTVYRLDEACRRLRVQVEQAKQDASGVQDLARRVSRENDSANFFQAQRRMRTPLHVLEALTALVPQDSWANQFSVHGQTVEIMGFSPHAANLIARIEASPVFENPRFRSPITASPDGKEERFHLAFDIRRVDQR